MGLEDELRALEAAAREDPEGGQAWERLVQAYLRAGQVELGLEILTRLVSERELGPDEAASFHRLQRRHAGVIGDPRGQLEDSFQAAVWGAVGSRLLLEDVPGAKAETRVVDPGSGRRLARLPYGGSGRRWVLPPEGDLARRAGGGSELEVSDFPLDEGEEDVHDRHGLEGRPEALGFCPDGRVLAAAVGPELVLLEVDALRLTRVALPGPPGRVARLEGAVFRPDGEFLLVHVGYAETEESPDFASYRQEPVAGRFALHRVDRRRGVRAGDQPLEGPAACYLSGPRFAGSTRALRVAWSPDGARLALVVHRSPQAGGPRLEIRDGETLGLLGEAALPPPVAAWSGAPWWVDGAPSLSPPAWVGTERVALGVDDRLLVFELSGDVPEPVGGGEGWGRVLAIFPTEPPDGALVVGSERYATVRLPAGRERSPLVGHRRPVRRLLPVAGGTRLATVDRSEELRLWEAASGECRAALRLAEHGVRPGGSPDGGFALGDSPDGEALVALGEDGLLLIDAERGEVVATLRVPAVPAEPDEPREHWYSAAPGPGGEVVFVSRVGQSNRLLSPTGEVLREGEGPSLRTALFVGGGRWIAGTTREHAYLLDGQTLEVRHRWEGPYDWGPCPHFLYRYPGDDAFVAQGGWGQPMVCPLDGGPARKLFPRVDMAPESLAFSPDGRTVASYPIEREGLRWEHLELWDAATGEPLAARELPGDPATGLAFTPCGSHVVHPRNGHLALVPVEGEGWDGELRELRAEDLP